MNVVLLEPAGTVTVPPAGTCAEAESLETLTVAPPVGAAPVSVTVAVEDWPPITVDGFMETDCTVGSGLMVSAALCVELL